jgi:hypothetical protein
LEANKANNPVIFFRLNIREMFELSLELAGLQVDLCGKVCHADLTMRAMQ